MCTQASPQCLFRVYAEYQAICPIIASCTPAQASVQVRFTIDQDPSITPLGGTPLAALITPGVFVSAAGSSLQPPSSACTGPSKALQWNGSNWVCQTLTLSSRSVLCGAEQISGSTYGCTALCNSDEVVTGGGVAWGSVFSNAGRNSYKNGNGWHCTINVHNCSGGLTGACGAQCQATCSKLAP